MGRMTGLIVVILAGVGSAFIPFDWLGPFAQAFHEGRWGMRLILFTLLVSGWLALDRAYALLRASFNVHDFMQQLTGMLQQGNVQGATQLCQEHQSRALARVIGAGLARAHEGEQRLLTAMDQAAYGEIPDLEKRTGFLALMGNVATLMGLFGTIIGLIHSFGAVSQSSGVAGKATLLAAGISEAMNCTAFGLLTGIFALVAFSALNGKTQRLIDEIKHQTLRAVRAWKLSHPVAHHERHPIAAPSAHLMHNVGLNKGKKGHGKRSTFASLQLTPLIDMFIVMVIFLLMSFSASGDIGRVAKDLKVPFAEKVEALQRALVVAISFPKDDPRGGVVTLEGVEVSTAKELLEDTGPDWKISKLTESLEAAKVSWKNTHPNEAFPGDLIMQVDQQVDFKIIKKVMYSAGLAGYTSLHFAVTQKGAGGGAKE